MLWLIKLNQVNTNVEWSSLEMTSITTLNSGVGARTVTHEHTREDELLFVRPLDHFSVPDLTFSSPRSFTLRSLPVEMITTVCADGISSTGFREGCGGTDDGHLNRSISSYQEGKEGKGRYRTWSVSKGGSRDAIKTCSCYSPREGGSKSRKPAASKQARSTAVHNHVKPE